MSEQTDEGSKRIFILGPCLLSGVSELMWSPGPMWLGDRKTVLACQSILNQKKVKELGAKVVDEFNEQTLKLGIESAIKHGADPQELKRLMGG